MRTRFPLFAAALITMLGVSSSASAFSVVVHVYLANAIHDELARNVAATGRPTMRLMQPDGSVVRVTIDEGDAQAILDNPQYFRGGAIGPDNTVMTGLTDPSHAWFFSPFQQCEALYQEALNEEARRVAAGTAPEDVPRSERAYALGCFLHGITDNNAHHVVNFFTGETFTLYPVDAAAGGELQFSLLNVVRHIVTETMFQESLEEMEGDFDSIDRARQGIMRDPLTPARLEHRIAVDLVLRVYFDQGDGGPTDLWSSYTDEAVAAKIDALRVALGVPAGAGIIETLIASPDPFADDITAVSAYVDFLRTGGLAPADYILLLPEIVRDVKNLYMIVNEQGIALGQDSSRANLLVRNLLKNAFAPRDDFGEDDWAASNPSRFEDVMTVKFRQLDAVMPAYVEAVQGISNLNISTGIQNATREERMAALAPLIERLNAITDIDYGILFSEPTMIITENVSFVTQALDAIIELIKMRVQEFIIEAAMVYLDQLKAEVDRIVATVLDRIDERILRTYENLQMRVTDLQAAATDEARRQALERIALDLTSGGPFDAFLDSVLYMNAFNSTAVVLARRDGVAPMGSGMFDGPVSFDASYQLEYTQFAICPEIREAIYPCGTSVGEMMQTDFRNCAALPEIADSFQPSIECHMGSTTMFGTPSPSSCMPVMFEEFNSSSGGDGSYTLAFPPEQAAGGPPACYLDGMDLEIEEGGPPDIPDGGLPDGADGGPSGGPGGDTAGCGCASSPSGAGGALPILAALTLLWMTRRRRV